MTYGATINTTSPEQTRRAGELLGGLTLPNDVIALAGDLGAGKTALVQGIARGLGVIGPVPSPTFNIVLVHRAAVPLFHVDLYRLDDPVQLVDIDFYETLESDGVTAIEWADRFPGELPDDRLDVEIRVLDPESRSITARGTGPRSLTLARAWVDSWRLGGGGGVQ
jgi:tRNA threonylcarbamoyladenosine biosynthesis protein TsaE